MNGKAQVIEMVEPTTDGGNLIKLKDLIHTQWYELQATKRANKDYAFLMKPVYDEIVRLGHEALETLEAVDPLSPFIKRIEGPLHETQRKSWVADDIAFIGPKPYYVMTPEAGQDVITQDINRLANAIHHAGMSLIKANESYCGCDIAEWVKDIKSINTGVLKYCEGALELGRKRALIVGEGDSVEHRPGSAAHHANTIRFVPTEKGHNITMEYMESGDANWIDRQDGVIEIVLEKGGKCESEGTIAKCQIENAPDDGILNLALIISQLQDIDLMSKDCIPLAFQLITQQAEELKEVAPKENIWEEPWTRVSDMTEIMECTSRGYEREEERRNREDILARRLEAVIGQNEGNIDSHISHSKKPHVFARHTIA